MKSKKISLRSRIFVYMILLVLVASVLIAMVTLYQYNEQSKDYHAKRLERKESQLLLSINYVLKETTREVVTDQLELIFKDKIYEIRNTLNVDFNIYDLEGTLIKSSIPTLQNDSSNRCIPTQVINTLKKSLDKRYVQERQDLGNTIRSLYTIFTDAKSKPIGVLNVPYFEDNSFNNEELKVFLGRLGYAYVAMLLIAIAFAYFVSKYITKSLKTVSDKMNVTRLEKRNEKIELKNASQELTMLITAYNSMIDDLEESAIQLAKSEREQAWREMAKQVAHEIKNPLTPMRLSVQSFQRKFNPQDQNIHHKVNEYSKTLIQQIDTMSAIASAFSNFAQMPTQQNETFNVVKLIDLALDIFPEKAIHFKASKKEIMVTFDKTQLIRVLTNLVKNAIQSIPKDRTPKINVAVLERNQNIIITVQDNGNGITEVNKAKIFEPKFTTKSSGMGLGLAMSKSIVETYNGNITFVSKETQGTTFTVSFPKQ